MTYIVFGGTLNLAQSIQLRALYFLPITLPFSKVASLLSVTSFCCVSHLDDIKMKIAPQMRLQVLPPSIFIILQNGRHFLIARNAAEYTALAEMILIEIVS